MSQTARFKETMIHTVVNMHVWLQQNRLTWSSRGKIPPFSARLNMNSVFCVAYLDRIRA